MVDQLACVLLQHLCAKGACWWLPASLAHIGWLECVIIGDRTSNLPGARADVFLGRQVFADV